MNIFHHSLNTVLKKETFRPETGKIIFFLLMWGKPFLHHCVIDEVLKTPIGKDWSQKVFDFDHIGKILDLFWDGKFFFFVHCKLGFNKFLFASSL